MTFLPQEIYVSTKLKDKATILYAFSEKLVYNRNFAYKHIYNRLNIVFKSTRENYTKSKNEKRRYDSISRSRQRIYDIVESNLGINKNMPIFATYTFKENVTNINVANKHFRNYIKRLNLYLKFKVQYLTVVEFQSAVRFITIRFFSICLLSPSKSLKKYGSMVQLISRL